MAIAFDKSGEGEGALNTATVNLAAAAANELAIIWLRWSPDYAFSSLTVDASSTGITQIGTEYTGFAGQRMRLYYLYNPPTTTGAYVFTSDAPGDGVNMMVQLYSGADSTQADSFANSTVTDTSLALTTTVVASNCWLVSFAVGGTPTAGSGTTQRTDGGADKGGDSNGTVAAGARTMNWTRSAGSGLIGGQILSLLPTGGGAVATTVVHNLGLLGVGQ